MRRAVLVVATAVLLAGCGSSTVDTAVEPAASPYSGPMRLPVSYADDATVAERSGAAGRALECDGDPYNGGGGDYDSGLESVQGIAAEALEDWLENEAWAYQVPESGYRVEREDADRVLLSYDVGERTKIAFIAADGLRDYNGDEGWGIESWSQCDPAELPASVTDTLDIGVWEDSSGRRMPVTKIRSFQGAEHCDWQDITFLIVGPEGKPEQYLRDTDGELAELLRTTFDATAALPDGATDTGMHRGGRQLWLGPGHEAAYLVSLDDADDVERWPAAKELVACR